MEDRRQNRPSEPTEGVRIIGEDEAEEAIRSGSAVPRKGEGEPRYGDRPSSPEHEGPRPTMRFPRPKDDADASSPPRPRGAPAADDDAQLPHWTEPATGEVPKVLAGDEPEPSADDLAAWSTFASGTPRWRDQPSDWKAADFDDPSRLADDSTRLGALDPRRTRHDDLFGDLEPETGSAPTATPAAAPPADRPDLAAPQPSAPAAPAPGGPRPPMPPAPPTDPGMGRNVPVAVGTGVAFAVIALLLLNAGPGAAMVLVATVITLASAELYSAFWKAGYQPATLLGLVASASLVGAAYWRGEAALPLVLGLTVVFSMLWYLTGVSRVRPTMNAAVTVLGVAYVGLLGSFGALLLKWPSDDGIGLLLGAIIATVGYDVGGFFIGRRIGQSTLAPEISPNKTIEGLVGGMGVAVFVSVVIVSQIHPWDFGASLALGVLTALVAPLGDLAESMIKRDLGIKDTGGILPGHGGLLDRFDGLLFVLPTTYYLARVLELGLG